MVEFFINLREDFLNILESNGVGAAKEVVLSQIDSMVEGKAVCSYKEMHAFISDRMEDLCVSAILNRKERKVRFYMILFERFEVSYNLKRLKSFAYINGAKAIYELLASNEIEIEVLQSVPKQKPDKWTRNIRWLNPLYGINAGIFNYENIDQKFWELVRNFSLNEGGVCAGLVYMWMYLCMIGCVDLHGNILQQLENMEYGISDEVMCKYMWSVGAIQIKNRFMWEECLQKRLFLRRTRLKNKSVKVFITEVCELILHFAVRFFTISYFFKGGAHITGFYKTENGYVFYEPNHNGLVGFTRLDKFLRKFLFSIGMVKNDHVVEGRVKVGFYCRTSEIMQIKRRVHSIPNSEDKIQFLLQQIVGGSL